ncbi:ubiquitin carboxyl-terminal hydrolase [Holotrichia oblita]|uniref:Ubiquitin carboxyl-terminal hydrolase n=1 Tax=Holotrichia oblita TaxID=644536 RepID=A0ACB9TZB7_HOLOL|nr:ubiquitin carboxyl-terminal hydrolase [Holotrichia oblita]
MPASTLDPVNAAIRSSLSKTASETNLDVQLAGATKKALLADIEFEAAGSYQTSVLDKLKTKYIVLKTPDTQQTRWPVYNMRDEEDAAGFAAAQHELDPAVPHLQQVARRLPQPDTGTAGGRARVPTLPGRGDGEGVPETFQELRGVRFADEGDDAPQPDTGRLSEVGRPLFGVRSRQHHLPALPGSAVGYQESADVGGGAGRLFLEGEARRRVVSLRVVSEKGQVPATKQFSLERAPMVLCIQLKRFSVSNNKITKHVQFRSGLELTKYARHRTSVPLVYKFVALVTHMGPTVGCGHYTAVAKAPCGNYYQFDDSMVRPISHQAVFSTNAYIMLYELECPPFAQKTQNNGSASATASTTSSSSTSSSSAASASCSPAGKIKANLSSSSNSNNNNNSNSSNSLTVHNSKDQPERNKPTPSLSNNNDNNNNNNSGGGGKSQQTVNGSARAPVYGPELPPNLSALVTLSAEAEQNGVVSSSGHDKKANATTTTTEQHQQQVHQRLAGTPSTSTTNDDDHDTRRQPQQQQQHRQNAKHEQRQAILPALIGNRNHRSVRQNGEPVASSSAPSTSSTPASVTTTAVVT